MEPDSKDEAFGELLEALETAASPSDTAARVRAMADKWEPAFPGIRAEFESMAGLAKLFHKPAPAPQQLAVPTSLPGFLDLTPIGAGGYGVVCGAVQIPFRRRVAVKIRSAGPSASAEARFEREQRVLARLHHTNIVPVHLSGRHGPYQFFVMKLIDGATLADLIGTLSDHNAPPAAISTLADHAARTADTRSREKTPASVPSLLGPPSPPSDHPPSERSFPVPPPASYFRSVAAVIAAAADALAHAHAAGVLHRDIKPSNIMVGRDGVCSIIDFGLAALSTDDDDPEVPRAGNGLTQGALGTTPYMAPEQFHRNPEVRSDVWGLGATLYELLTLRRAYPRGAFKDAAAAVPADAPSPPRALCPAVPADLEAICLRALRRDPAERYASPADVAEDLRRWQRGETTTARPRPPHVRAAMWARRNPGWAGMLASLLACVVVGAAAGVLGARATAATAKAEAAEERGKTAASQAEAHASLLASIQASRLTRYPQVTWSQTSLEHVRRAAAVRPDEPLRTQAVALLAGIDAVPRPSLPGVIGGSLALDPKGRLLIGGVKYDGGGKVASQPPRLWDDPLQKPRISDRAEPGPVAFRPDGTALQLFVTPDDRNTLALWDAGAGKLVRTLTVPGARKKDPLRDAGDLGAKMALSADGKFAAAGVSAGPFAKVVVWDTDTGAVLFDDIPDAAPTAITVAPANPDGASFVAVGDKRGRVFTWTLPDGKKQPTLAVDHGGITALAVGADVSRHDRPVPVPALRNRLLAVGGGTSRVSVWELESSAVRSYCDGSQYAVYALAFAPDGVTLASGGRYEPRLWDTATGRLLLELQYMDYVHGIAFSPDGRTLAYTGRNVFNGNQHGTFVFAVENGRGTQTLRGLTAALIRTAWSPDGNLVAGLSHDWKVAVWDRRTGLLLHRFEVPESRFVDNVTMEFSTDAKHLVYAGSRAAFRWDLATGKLMNEWPLADGLSNQLLYAGPGKLFLFRQEGTDSRRGPFGLPLENPRRCRIRNLLAADPDKLILDSPELSWDVRLAAASRAESCFLVDGSAAAGDKGVRGVRAFDAATGKLLWGKGTAAEPYTGGGLGMDPTGEFVVATLTPDRHAVLRVRTGDVVEVSPVELKALGRPNGFYLTVEGMLRRRADKAPLFRLGIDDTRTAPPGTWFDPSGTRAAWVTTEGAIRVCDLTAAQERLAALGLNW